MINEHQKVPKNKKQFDDNWEKIFGGNSNKHTVTSTTVLGDSPNGVGSDRPTV